MVPVFANLFSGPDLLIVAVVVLLLFGNRLPAVMRSLGQGVTEFKKGVAGIEDETAEQKKIPDAGAKLDDSHKTTEERTV